MMSCQIVFCLLFKSLPEGAIVLPQGWTLEDGPGFVQPPIHPCFFQPRPTAVAFSEEEHPIQLSEQELEQWETELGELIYQEQLLQSVKESVGAQTILAARSVSLPLPSEMLWLLQSSMPWARPPGLRHLVGQSPTLLDVLGDTPPLVRLNLAERHLLTKLPFILHETRDFPMRLGDLLTLQRHELHITARAHEQALFRIAPDQWVSGTIPNRDPRKEDGCLGQCQRPPQELDLGLFQTKMLLLFEAWIEAQAEHSGFLKPSARFGCPFQKPGGLKTRGGRSGGFTTTLRNRTVTDRLLKLRRQFLRNGLILTQDLLAEPNTTINDLYEGGGVYASSPFT